MSDSVDQDFVELFEKNVTFQSHEEEVKYWKGIAYDPYIIKWVWLF